MSIFVTQLLSINIYRIDIEGDKHTDFIHESIEKGSIDMGEYKYLFKWFFDIFILYPTQVQDLSREIDDFIKNIDSVKNITSINKKNIIEHFDKIQREIREVIKNKYYVQIFLC